MMPYTVFALKWRPKNFDEIIGQSHIVTTLKNAIQKERLANAYLFAGPRGVGKTSMARVLAKALNCKNGPTINPCLRCPSCIEISQSRSLDVIEIDGASNRGIDEIRVLRENVKFAPVGGKFKIYIIDEVHMLTQEAFNALLKTLEEPPQFVKFIFATTQPHKVIATILSRCQRCDFRRITAMEITAQLERIAVSEKIDVDKEVLFAIARASDGSLRDAESILDQLFSFSKEKITLGDVVSVLGLIEQEALFEVTDKIIQKDTKAVLSLLGNLIEDGKDTGVITAGLIEHFRNLMIAKVAKADPELIDLPDDVCLQILKQSQAFSLEELFSSFNILANTQEMTKRLDSLRTPLEINLVRLAHDKRGVTSSAKPEKDCRDLKDSPAEDLSSKDKMPKSELLETNKNDDVPEAKGPKDLSCSISLDTIKNSWQKIINRLEKIKMSVATYLNEGEPLKFQGSVLTVVFPKNYLLHKEALERKENKTIIEKNISELFNTNLRLNFLLSKEEKEAENHQNNPFVKSALETFNGRVIKE